MSGMVHSQSAAQSDIMLGQTSMQQYAEVNFTANESSI